MNIFFLDDDPRQAARDLGDRHVGKMLLEACQMMSTAARANGFDGGYASAYENHPMTKWVGTSMQAFNWAWEHALACGEEHERRFGTYHKSLSLLPTLSNAMHTVIPDAEWRNPPRCMPDEYKLNYDIHKSERKLRWDNQSSHVSSYRLYYINTKQSCHKWTNHEHVKPKWFDSHAMLECA